MDGSDNRSVTGTSVSVITAMEEYSRTGQREGQGVWSETNTKFFPQAFKLLSGHVTLECLELILAVLRPKQGLGEVMEAEQEDEQEAQKEEEEEEEEGDSEEEAEDEEKGKDETTDSEEDAEDSSSSSDGDGGQEVGGVDPEFAESVRQALGAAAAMGSDEEVCLYILTTPITLLACRVETHQMMRQ